MGLIDSIVGAESGGDANARNPNSSASGAGQFIDSTWLSMIRQHRPDLADGKTDADLLALKTNPDLSREMTGAYAADNGAILSRAGLPVTPGTTYLAHFAGPQGAVSVLQADPAAPVSSVMTPAAMKANPFLQGMTVGDLQAWADRKMGGKTAAPPAAQVAAPASLPIPPSAVPSFAPQDAPPPTTQPSQPDQQSYFAQMPAEQMAMQPIFAPQRKAIDLSKLRAAFKAPTFARG